MRVLTCLTKMLTIYSHKHLNLVKMSEHHEMSIMSIEHVVLQLLHLHFDSDANSENSVLSSRFSELLVAICRTITDPGG